MIRERQAQRWGKEGATSVADSVLQLLWEIGYVPLVGAHCPWLWQFAFSVLFWTFW